MNILLESCRGPSRSRYETARTSSVQNSPAYTYAAACGQLQTLLPPTHMTRCSGTHSALSESSRIWIVRYGVFAEARRMSTSSIFSQKGSP